MGWIEPILPNIVEYGIERTGLEKFQTLSSNCRVVPLNRSPFWIQNVPAGPCPGTLTFTATVFSCRESQFGAASAGSVALAAVNVERLSTSASPRKLVVS